MRPHAGARWRTKSARKSDQFREDPESDQFRVEKEEPVEDEQHRDHLHRVHNKVTVPGRAQPGRHRATASRFRHKGYIS